MKVSVVTLLTPVMNQQIVIEPFRCLSTQHKARARRSSSQVLDGDSAELNCIFYGRQQELQQG